MTCSHVRRQMTLYLERWCPADEATAIAHHIESCPSCAAQVADYQRVKTLLQQVRTVSPDPSLWSEMMVAIREQRAQMQTVPVSAHRRWVGNRVAVFRRPLYAISTAAAIIITGATIVWHLLTMQPAHVAQGPRDGDDMAFYLKEHALVADQSVFSNGTFGFVLANSARKK